MNLKGDTTPEEREIVIRLNAIQREEERLNKLDALDSEYAKSIVRKHWHASKDKKSLYNSLKQIGMKRDEIASYLGYSSHHSMYNAINDR